MRVQILFVLTFCAAILSFFQAPARAEEYDVFLLAGQSNMDGRAAVSDLVGPLAPFAARQDDVKINYSNSGMRGPLLTSGGWKPLEPGYSVAPHKPKPGAKKGLPGATFGPEVAFGKALAASLPGRHVALIKFAEGGTSLKQLWSPEDRNKLYDKCLAHIRSSLKELEAKGDHYVLRGMIWHQGESDARLPAEEYQKLLTQFIERLRTDVGVKDLPFVVGEVYDNGKRDAVRQALRAVAQSVPDAGFVSAKGLKTFDGGTHFDAASQIELGKRFADEMLKRLPPSVKGGRGK